MAKKANGRRKRGCLWWGLRVVGGLLGLLIVLLAFSVINQRIGLARDLKNLPAPGELVDVDGHLMHIYCIGEGSPTVVIDAGNSDFSLSWWNIQQELAQDTRVCTYDRAGYGWSEPTDSPRDAAHVVEELHELLASEDSGPYLMVGHSLGGLYVQLYTLSYPEEVLGLVLVDSPPADIISTPEYRSLKPQNVGFYTTMRTLTGSGLLRLFGPLLGEEALPEVAKAFPEIADQYLTLVQQPSHWQTALDELDAIEISAEQVSEAFSGEYPFDDLPLIVLSAGDHPPDAAGQIVFEAHVRQAQLSTQGERRVVEGSRHVMNIDAPEAIIQAVNDLR